MIVFAADTESVVTRLVLISCFSDHALAWLKIHPCVAFDVLSRLFVAPRFIPMSSITA